AYVGNPMQLSTVVLLVMLGLIVWNPWLAAAGVMAHLCAAGLAGWDEDEDLRRRFGDAWTEYQRGVRRWVPRLRPWHRPDHPPARLYVSTSWNRCRDVARWFERRALRQLVIVRAETHAAGALGRIRLGAADGSRSGSGSRAGA